ncbi:MAG: heavy-metal-associated domain-containing protein [Bacteroidota bacterium]
MNKFGIFLICTVIAVVSACSGAKTEEVADSHVKVTRAVVKDANVQKCTAKIAVDGMSCSKMCTGAIEGCLKKIDGVKVTRVYFDPERKADDFAAIEFDDKKVTEKEMIAAIEKLNDGQYKVKSVEIVVSEVSYEKIDDKSDKKDETKPAASGKVTALNTITMAVPGIFAIVKRMIR